jgi:hypothetical protein
MKMLPTSSWIQAMVVLSILEIPDTSLRTTGKSHLFITRRNGEEGLICFFSSHTNALQKVTAITRVIVLINVFISCTSFPAVCQPYVKN